VTNEPDAKAGTSFERAGDGGVVLHEEEFRQVGHDLEARAVHLATVLKQYLEHLERPHIERNSPLSEGFERGSSSQRSAVAALDDAATQIREAGFALGETCVSYVEGVDKADRQFARTRNEAGAP
jgi:hypothetical protein